MLKRVTSLMPAALAVAAIMVAGCAVPGTNKDGGGMGVLDGSKGGGMMTGQVAARPPAPTPAPAPRPAPRTGACNTVFYPTGHEVGAALRVDRYQPAEVSAGQTFDYEIKVTNVAPVTLENVMVMETAATNYTMTSATPSGAQGAAPNGGTVYTYNLGSLASGESKSIKITGKAGSGASIASCATVSYVLPICCTTAVTAPALKITKQAPAEVSMCDTIPVHIVVTNSGTGVARNVVVRDNFPAGMTTGDGKNGFESNIGNLNAGESRNVDFSVKVNKTGSYNNSASAAAEGGLSATSNTTTTVVRNCNLSITKSATTAKMFTGRDATFNITVANNGDGVAKSVVVEDPIPAGGSFKSASEGGRLSGNTVTWNLGDMAPGASKTLTVVVNSGGLMGSMNNTATAHSVCCQAVNASAAVAFDSIPAIVIELVDEPDPLSVGEETTFTVKVRNQGFKADTNLKAVFTLANGLSFVSGGGASPVSASGQTVTMGTVASIAAKQEVVWTVRVKCTGANGDVRSKLSVTTDFFKSPIDEEESTNTYQ